MAFVGGPLTIGQVADRYEGARQAWAEAGLPEEDLVLVTCQAPRRVPEDLAIVGYDDIECAAAAAVTLTPELVARASTLG